MRYLSVCSGIEAATVAWKPLKWTPAAFSEIEPFPCAVLEHHYPDVPNFGDITQHEHWPSIDADILVGGTPCQSFSVAGRRAGLSDPRGNLTLVYLAIVERLRPRWLVWENVPGVLSTDDGRTFGAILGTLAKFGYGFAYRIFDARYFGVPQSRRRVFVVGHLGDWRRAAAVLFDQESLRGNPSTNIPTQKDSSSTFLSGTNGSDKETQTVIAFHNRQDPDCRNLSPALSAKDNGLGVCFYQKTKPIVRRLTPRECERLQGFPDDYTLVEFRGRMATDTPRYRAIGNSMAVPVMRKIGERISMVDQYGSENSI